MPALGVLNISDYRLVNQNEFREIYEAHHAGSLVSADLCLLTLKFLNVSFLSLASRLIGSIPMTRLVESTRPWYGDILMMGTRKAN
jgi:hypothetical protein